MQKPSIFIILILGMLGNSCVGNLHEGKRIKVSPSFYTKDSIPLFLIVDTLSGNNVYETKANALILDKKKSKSKSDQVKIVFEGLYSGDTIQVFCGSLNNKFFLQSDQVNLPVNSWSISRNEIKDQKDVKLIIANNSFTFPFINKFDFLRIIQFKNQIVLIYTNTKPSYK